MPCTGSCWPAAAILDHQPIPQEIFRHGVHTACQSEKLSGLGEREQWKQQFLETNLGNYKLDGRCHMQLWHRLCGCNCLSWIWEHCLSQTTLCQEVPQVRPMMHAPFSSKSWNVKNWLHSCGRKIPLKICQIQGFSRVGLKMKLHHCLGNGVPPEYNWYPHLPQCHMLIMIKQQLLISSSGIWEKWVQVGWSC